jgi:hypothetical protein
MKKSKIKKAMKKNVVWCIHKEYAPGVLLCNDLNCPYKNDEGRLAKPKELKKCKSFIVTKPTDKFERSVSVLVPGRKARDRAAAAVAVGAL